MTSNPAIDIDNQCLPLATIQMTASEFKDFVTNIESTNLGQKLMPIAKICSGESRAEVTDDTLNQFVQFTNICTARSYFNGPRKVAAADSQVSSSEASEGTSQEYVLAQELQSAKASGIDSTFVEQIQAAKSSVTEPSTLIDNVLDDHTSDLENILQLAGSSHSSPPNARESIEDPLYVVPECENEQEHHASAVNDSGTLVCAPSLQHDNERLTEKQDSATVNSNDGSAQIAIPPAIGNQDDDIEPVQPAPLAALGSERDLPTSETFFTAISAMGDVRSQSSNLASKETQESIQPNIGSSGESCDSSEIDYMPPWEATSIADTDAIVPSEEMALVTEDLVPETESDAILGRADTLNSASKVIEDFEESDSEDGRISIANASLVLMQRNKEGCIEEVSSNDDLSSEDY